MDVEVVSFTVIGISSHENDYRLSWSINEQLGLALAKADNISIGDDKEFTCFAHEDERQALQLISNRCDNGFLLEKYKNLDFFLKFGFELSETEKTDWFGRLKNVPLISALFHIPVDRKILRVLG